MYTFNLILTSARCSMPRPVVDRHEYVIGVVAGSPKFQSGWWSQIVKKVLQDIKRMERNDLFSSGDLNSPLGASTSRIRFGIGFGEAYPVSPKCQTYPSTHRTFPGSSRD